MKNLKFKSITIISHREQKARRIAFHPQKNVLIGQNHTGKSSLLKTLFLTLGARPNGKLAQWDENVVSIVEISIGDILYTVTYHVGNRSLFDVNGKLVFASSSYPEWVSIFSIITGFNLPLTDKNQKTVNADSKCFFLPFYIDQDSSWGGGWDTFPGLQYFKSPVASIIDFFSGIKPPEFYELDSEVKQEKSKLDNLRKDDLFLERARNRFKTNIFAEGPKLDPSNFEAEIKELTNQVNKLNHDQEIARDKLVRHQELINSLKLQIESAQLSLLTYDKDSKYLEQHAFESLICPTCGAEHNRPFIEILTYADEARILRELVSMLKKDLLKAGKLYNEIFEEYSDLQKQYQSINKILDTRKGDLLFRDVVESAGAEKALLAFRQESEEINIKIDESVVTIDKLEQEIIKLRNPKKAKKIKKQFHDAYSHARIKLNLLPIDVSKMQLTSRPNISGSGGPRAILAYYYALWVICYSEFGSFAVPIVIDSPNQKAQDEVNLPKVIKFIAEDLPDSAQLIVGSETKTEFKFDKEIELDKPYSVLLEEEFDSLNKEAELYLVPMYEYLSK